MLEITKLICGTICLVFCTPMGWIGMFIFFILLKDLIKTKGN